MYKITKYGIWHNFINVLTFLNFILKHKKYQLYFTKFWYFINSNLITFYLWCFMFTPIIPPNIPSTLPVISIYIVFEFIEKSLFTKLDAKYKIIIYITEITIPLIIPYFFNFIH